MRALRILAYIVECVADCQKGQNHQVNFANQSLLFARFEGLVHILEVVKQRQRGIAIMNLPRICAFDVHCVRLRKTSRISHFISLREVGDMSRLVEKRA